MDNGVGSVLRSIVSDPNQVSLDSMTLFVGLICASIVLIHLLEENQWINECTTALFVGLASGIIILVLTQGRSSHILKFNEVLFFIYLLPPIIFNAGFQVRKKQFFRNFMTIVLFGAAGTLISFCIISFGAKWLFETSGIGYLELQDYLAIGAIFSATDSVCTLQVLNQDEMPLLYSLVFGEGVVNDAMSIVLFNAIKKFDLSRINSIIVAKFIGNFSYLFITSTLLGVLTGLLCAYTLKKLYFRSHSTDSEVALMILMAYLSYLMAELLDLSGILTVFFCGIIMSHYAWHNATEQSRVTTEHAFATLSFVAEIFIFLYVGMDALDIEKWKFVSKSPGKSIRASTLLLVLIMIGRASFVFPLSFISNLGKKSDAEKLDLTKQVTIWWAGLMRGAASMALAYNQFAKYGETLQQEDAIMVTSTITIVLVSTVVFGLLTKPLMRLLLPAQDSTIPSDSSSLLILPLLCNRPEAEGCGGKNLRRPSLLHLLITTPTNTVHYYWRRFDDTYMRLVFGGPTPG